ncbi:MAG: 5-formyltetrahydrofolate cyclo-ligase [Bacteroidetes bacterium]|nr:5-formyltetrahydrofolate cyclo-ligase [Bacteroidota bacterium]
MHESLLLRKKKLAERNTLTLEDIQEKSQKIEERLFSIAEMVQGNTFFIYVDFRSEVHTLGILLKLIERDKIVTVPITHVNEKRLDAIQITRPEEELSPGYCNIPEPIEEIWERQKINPKEIEVIILPGSVFDERCGRFGYGGGYYDRFLDNIPHATRIGLAFELQMVERAPLKEHDELLDYVVTEQRIIKGKR